MARNKDKPDIPPGTPFQRVLPMLITFLVVALAGPMLFSAYWLNTFSTVACLTLVAGTVSLLYGQLGMVSLAQFALTGVGGWFCLRLIHGLALPFELALIIGAVVAGLFGLILGLPALRMRGLYLALLLSGAAFAYMHRDLVVDEIEQFKKYLLRGTPAVAMTPEDVASAEAAAKAAAEAASAAAQAQSQAQVASEPQAVASAIGTSASEASSKDVLPATAPPATNSAASAPLSVASAPAVSAPESTSKEVKDTKANRSKKSDDLSDEAWVKQLTDSSYVLQLSAADTEEDILKFKNSHPIYAKARVMSAPKKDSKKHYFILVAGPFENKTDADSYVNSHPLLSKGWLRNAKSMRNQFLRTQP